MTWRVVFSPGVEQDVAEATVWYEGKQPGLGHEFLFEVIQVWHSLADNPLLGARKHPVKTSGGAIPSVFLTASSTRWMRPLKPCS